MKVDLKSRGFVQRLKNAIGSFIGFSSCNICGRTWWKQEHTTVWYSKNSGIMVCNNCFEVQGNDFVLEFIAIKEHVPLKKLQALNMRNGKK